MENLKLTGDQRVELNNGFDDRNERNSWFQDNGEAVGLSKDIWWVCHWSIDKQQFFMTDPNNTVDFDANGFYWPGPVYPGRELVVSIEAEVKFFTKKKRGCLIEGEYVHPGFEERGFWDRFFSFFECSDLCASPVNDWSGLSPDIRGVLHFDVISDGRERYKLVVDHAPDLGQLSQFVSRLRANRIQPTMAWS
ncbi:MAG: hypothetical protein V1695_03825 [Candidatus Uhrbacteria bacterium]